MKDIDIAKGYLTEENLTIAVVKDKNVVYKSKEKGIKPMYILAREMKDIAKDGSVADKVIGKGAALLCQYMGIKEVYGGLMSETAMDVLNRGNINFDYDEITPYIQNRDKTGLCPIENMSMDIEDGEILLKEIRGFMKK